MPSRAGMQPHVVITDMTHMHQYVYDMYIAIVQNMNSEEAKLQKTLSEPVVNRTEQEEAVEHRKVAIDFEIRPPEELMGSHDEEEGGNAYLKSH